MSKEKNEGPVLAASASSPQPDLVTVTTGIDTWYRGKMYRAGDSLQVTRADASAKHFNSPTKASSEQEEQAARAAAEKDAHEAFMERVRQSAEIRRQGELVRAQVAQRQLETQAARAKEAAGHAGKLAAVG